MKSRVLAALLACWMTPVVALPLYAGDVAATLIEAEKSLGAAARAYRDPRASAANCAVLVLKPDGSGGEVFRSKLTLPAGDYLATAWVEVYPLHLLHGLSLIFNAGPESRNYGTAQFDPKPGFQPITIKFFHPGGVIDLSMTASGVSGFDGMRYENSDEEKNANKLGAAPAGKVTLATDEKIKALEDADKLDLNENPPTSNLTYTDNRVICDCVEIASLRSPTLAVTGVDVDKVHYLPGETVKATAKVNGLASGGACQFVAELVTEADSARQVFVQDLTLSPRKNEVVEFGFPLDGKTEFGHELRCYLKQGGKIVHDASAIFGVSKNVYRIGITANSGPQNKASMTAEEAAKIHQANKEKYANYFELFAWAPSEMSNMTPKTERWWSGQTMYPGSRTGFANFFSEAKKRGIKGMTYGSIAAGGIDGYESVRRFPSLFVTSEGVSQLSTYFLERSWREEYSLPIEPPKNGRVPISWSFWSEVWASETPEAMQLNIDQIIGTAEQFGFDGMRWDFWWNGKMAEVKKRVEEKHPGFIWGYNVAFATPGSALFLPNRQSGVEDFHEICRDHGLIMDESVRGWSRTFGGTRPYYEAICREANYVKRAGGLPLFITFDLASRLDSTFSILCGLAAGERYTYMTSPGDFAFGPLPKFLTRFSAFIWDDTAMIADAARVVGVKVGKGPANVMPWWDQSVWLRKLPGGRQQLLVNLVNPVGYQGYCGRVQPPPSTLENVSVTVPMPTGAKLVRAFHLSPDLTEGSEPLVPTSSGAQATITLPRLRNWSIAVFELGPENGGELACPAYALTTPIEDAAAFMKSQDEKAARAIQAQNDATKIGQNAGGAEAAAVAVPAVPPAPRPWQPFYYQFDKSFNGDEPATKSYARMTDMNIRRNGVLDVHHIKGPFSWLNPIEQAVGLAGGGVCSSSYVYRERFRDASNGYMFDFPDSLQTLFQNDVVVLDNTHAMDLGPRRRAMLAEYVKNGGGLLFFGGLHTLTMGWMHNTAMDEVMPVNVNNRFQITWGSNALKLAPGPDAAGFFRPDVDWGAKPSACSIDHSPLRAGVQVLATLDGMPAIVRWGFGKGRVIVFLINPSGDFPRDSLPYWEWKSYPSVLASCLKWLGDGAEKHYEPKPDPVAINPSEVLPSDLAVEGATLSTPEFTKRLRSAQKNMIDATTARITLDTAVENIDKIDDLELVGGIATSAEQFVDASFVPLARKLLSSQHTMFKRVGLRVLGMTGDKTMRALAESALSVQDQKTQRVALCAIGKIGDPASVSSIRQYLAQGGTENMLALSVLVRIGDPKALAEALPLYAERRYKELAIKTSRLGQYHMLTTARLTPQSWKRLNQIYLQTLESEQNIAFDNAHFHESLTVFTPASVETLSSFFSASDSYRVCPLAHLVLTRLPPTLASKFRAGLSNAAMVEIRSLAQP